VRTDRWHALSPLLDQALELEGEARAQWLAALRRDDPTLAGALDPLLRDAEDVLHDRYLERAPRRPSRTGDATGGDGDPAQDGGGTLAGQVFGAYTLERLLGRGGMGAVWIARRSDGRFEGTVAVKLLNAALIGHAAEERFRREGQVLARLAHSHITRLLDAGVGANGQPYLVLEIVDGERIDRYCDARHLGVDARLALFLDVLDAVAHAHANLIVHRDIKPENVLVARDGAVKLLDFGIAKLLEDEDGAQDATKLTREGGRLLTPEYAAPEQLTGRPVTTATDVWALGVLLYQILVGQHPAGQATRSPADLVRSIIDTPPLRASDAVCSTRTRSAKALATSAADRGSLPPNRLRERLRGDLDSIVAKALEKDPGDRYASVTAFADDIRRHLADEPVSARPDSVAYRARKFVSRNRIAVALASLAVLATLAGLAGTLTQAQRATQERDFALRQLSRLAAISDLDDFLLTDAAPGKPFTAAELVARAERTVERAAPDASRSDMLVALGRQYRSMNEYASARRMIGEAYALSRTQDDPSARAQAACQWAYMLADQGDLAQANRVYADALAELGDKPQYLLDRVNCLLSGSSMARQHHQQAASSERAEAAQALIARMPYPPRALELRGFTNLADAYRVAGDFARADAAFAVASDRMRALGRADTRGASTLLNNWAITLVAMGQPLRAEALLRRAIELQSDGTSAPSVSPLILSNYAATLRDLDRVDEAIPYADRAYAAAERAGNQVATTMALLGRANVYTLHGDYAAARNMLDEAEPRMHRMLAPDNAEFAVVAILRAMIATASHDEAAAIELADRAVDIVAASSEAESLLPVILTRRAMLELDLGRASAAEADAARALAVARPTIAHGPPSSRVGRAYLALARAEAANGKAADAQHAAAAAVAQLEPTVGADDRDTRLARQLAAARALPAYR